VPSRHESINVSACRLVGFQLALLTAHTSFRSVSHIPLIITQPQTINRNNPTTSLSCCCSTSKAPDMRECAITTSVAPRPSVTANVSLSFFVHASTAPPYSSVRPSFLASGYLRSVLSSSLPTPLTMGTSRMHRIGSISCAPVSAWVVILAACEPSAAAFLSSLVRLAPSFVRVIIVFVALRRPATAARPCLS